MTPKEKAKELVDKFIPLVTTWDCYNDSPRLDEDIIIDAKQCALIAVDEIIEDLSFLWLHNAEFEEQLDTREKYWQEVKQELSKI